MYSKIQWCLKMPPTFAAGTESTARHLYRSPFTQSFQGRLTHVREYGALGQERPR
jgi:hypothetical protein